MRFIGIDYSITCPCLTIIDGSSKFEDVEVHFLTDKPKFAKTFSNINGHLHQPYVNSTQRYETLACALISLARIQESDTICLEDYSMGSKGLIFTIAENTAILKYLLYQKAIQPHLVSPSRVKKTFSDKGNADKNVMYKSFLDQTNIDLYDMLKTKPTLKVGSPISDIVDSYALALIGANNLHIK